MPKIAIKRASQADWSTIRDLNKKLFPQNPMADDTYESSVWWLAWDRDTPVGYAGLYLGIEGEAWLVRVGVLEPYRGGGLGWRLVRVRLRYWEHHVDDTELRTYVAEWNTASHKNVIRAGLVPYRSYDGWVYYRRGARAAKALTQKLVRAA